MSEDITQKIENAAAHISDYIKEGNFFNTFGIEDIEKIMKISNLTANEFATLVRQSHDVIKSNELYVCARNANISIQNFEDVISILNSIKEHMNFGILNGIVDFLNRNANEVESLKSQIIQIKEEYNMKEYLPKILELKKSNDFKKTYAFLEELSTQGNKQIFSKACEEGLWLKQKKGFLNRDVRNVFHIACERGNLQLVKYLISAGADKDKKDNSEHSPLLTAVHFDHRDIVQYLVSIGADKDAPDDYGQTPLFYASRQGQLEILQYLISVGANLEAKDKNDDTPLSVAKNATIRDYLVSVGAK
ncbi:ankyrin repeat protein, putative [Trichomonas vaginalis G3]|uniref:Ankyrin repeat protein, putative n=1 Tax=Trichomonas vaginalis (strain ATCC PRA-98 / G3) TaxID=412133 RepID=A2G7M9_TRIV3|nr:proteasome regulatory particle assembly [Trichomonas vaginalis G3]EAX86840.1 ankyrin repeat protein, putative [Trichomonas vaginalis G3]KAI5549787.1 proteasome regulatory particle assembly [Trichomonas vaginalis G3]|eukprot:XP_001299770.1 ankyrin repeat protein [Trichomonas vaginalis G3]